MTRAGKILEALAYHGSDNTIEGWFRSWSKSTNSYGLFGNVSVERRGVFFSKNRKLSQQYGKNVHRYRLDIRKTCVITSAILDKFKRALTHDRQRDGGRDMALDIKYMNHTWELFDDELGDVFVDWLIMQGYDSAQFEETFNNVSGTTIVVFDPKKIYQVDDNPRQKLIWK